MFTVGDLDRFLSERGSGNTATRKSLLAYHRRRGHIVPIRRGLYAAVPRGMRPGEAPVDPFLVAARLTEDAVLAYHTALEFHGRAYSVHWRVVYVSAKRSLPMEFRSHEYRRAPVPPPLLRIGKEMFGVIDQDHSGVELRVTSHERTFVDVLDRPDLTGEWEEIWRSLELVEFFDLDQVVEYTRLLDYIGALDREEMLADRRRVEWAAQAVFSREGFTVRRTPDEHAGGKWRLAYVSYAGRPAVP